MGRTMVVFVVVMITLAVIAGLVGLMVLSYRRWRDGRLLDLDPSILVQKGRLNRDAARKLARQRQQLGSSLNDLVATRDELAALLSDEVMYWPTEQSRQKVVARVAALDERITKARKSLTSPKGATDE